MIGVPVKPFGVAKARLSPRLDARTRARLGMALTRRTISISSQLGEAAVVTSDPAVRQFCTRHGIAVIREPAPGGLEVAANAVVETANQTGRSWAVVAADLPLFEAADLEAALAQLVEYPIVLSPSHDGGTNLIAGRLPRFDFAYGPGSFHRHLQPHLPCGVVSRLGLALDLDTPADLDTVAAHPRGRWLADLIGELANPQPAL